jgi:hypothetical protein
LWPLSSHTTARLVGVPAEVRGEGRAAPDDAHLLPRDLADVADPEVAGLAVEGEAPRVPQAVGDDRPSPPRHRSFEQVAVLEVRMRPRPPSSPMLT